MGRLNRNPKHQRMTRRCRRTNPGGWNWKSDTKLLKYPHVYSCRQNFKAKNIGMVTKVKTDSTHIGYKFRNFFAFGRSLLSNSCVQGNKKVPNK